MATQLKKAPGRTSAKRMTLWHISSKDNIQSIFDKGIDPLYSCGKQHISWYVKWYGLLWAIAHISLQKRVPIWQLAVFKVNAPACRFVHFNRNVYTSKWILHPSRCMPAERALYVIDMQRGYIKRVQK